MRVLLVFCHPVEDSYQDALHRAARAALERAGHEVDDLDLYGKRFDPVLSREEWLSYHDLEVNRRPVQAYSTGCCGPKPWSSAFRSGPTARPPC
jgi:putative NADPH-quinone reductase